MVVIGGGVVGVMTAWFAARAGQRVVLLEKGRIAGEQSARNWGWIRQQGRDPDELPLVIEANRIWRGLQAETNEDLGLRQSGTCYLTTAPSDAARYEAWMAHGRAHGLDTRMLTAAQIGDLMPGLVHGAKGALWTPSDLRAEPWVAVPALARAAARAGVSVHEGCAVRRLDVTNGAVTGVVTEAGRTDAPRVVLAGGAWSSLFLREHGIDIPQLSVLASVAATEPLPAVFEGCAADADFAFRRRADGGYSIAPSGAHDNYIGPDAFRHLRRYAHQLPAEIRTSGFRLAAPAGWPDAWGTPRRWSGDEASPFERMRILDPPPNRRRLAEVARRFAAAFPQLGPVRLRRTWAGMIDTLPDIVPVIDRAASLRGLVIATGLSGHGFGIGPGVGRVAADLAMDRDPGHDLTRFRLARFSDGTRLRPGPHL